MDYVVEDVIIDMVETVSYSAQLDEIIQLLSSIARSLDTLLGVFLVLITVYFVWTVLSKWLFGGV